MASPPTQPRGDLLRAVIFLPLGLCLLLVTYSMVEARVSFLAQALRADGHVSALNAGGSHPQIDFTDATGQAFSYPEDGLIYGYAVGDPVSVRYQAEAPARTAIIEDRGALWGASLMMGLFAIVATTGGGYHLAAWIRRRRTARS